MGTQIGSAMVLYVVIHEDHAKREMGVPTTFEIYWLAPGVLDVLGREQIDQWV